MSEINLIMNEIFNPFNYLILIIIMYTTFIFHSIKYINFIIITILIFKNLIYDSNLKITFQHILIHSYLIMM